MIAPKSYTEQTSAADKMVLAHLDLVRRLAWHFQGRVGRFIEIEDLIQAGYLGLVDAAKRYCVQEGVSFAAYAAIVIVLRHRLELRRRWSMIDLRTRMAA